MNKIPTPNIGISFEKLHKTIMFEIVKAIPEFNVVADYKTQNFKLGTPACFIEVAQLNHDLIDAPLTNQLALNCDFIAHVVINKTEPDMKVRTLAIELAGLINNNRWGLPIDPAILTTIETESFTPELEGFNCWSIQWTQLVYFKNSIFYKTDQKNNIVKVNFLKK